jgi:hypothetical protein
MYKISYLIMIVVIILAAIYFYFFIKKNNTYQNNQEGFTPKINSLCRPHLRNIRVNYETFENKYGSDFIINKLKKMNIY